MRLIVLVKQTLTTEARIALNDSGGIEDAKIKKVVNPYDEFAVEEAVQLREKGVAEHVTVVTVGPESAVEASRHCLAMGADEAVRIDDSEIESTDSFSVAEVLGAALKGMEFDLLLAGQVAVDDNASQVAVRVAEILGLPQINVVSKIELGEGEVTASREADGQTEVLTAKLPALVTTDKGINKPRYPTLPNIMKAKKKPLTIKSLSDLGIAAPTPKVKVVAHTLRPAKQGAKIFAGTPAEAAAQLAEALRNEAKVI
ncbi:MAG: electron transfer flavoprotein subunit beta/FixA family protein [Planctomycetales bacterium]|nr:electron transfer flavoprotein subunit beta/FixA family protein [Planctomycetales bacterium]